MGYTLEDAERDEAYDKMVEEILENYTPELEGEFLEKFGKQFAFHIFGYHHHNRHFLEGDDFFGVILDEHGTVAELVEFLRVTFGGLVADIVLRVKQLGGTLHARADFPDLE